MSANGLINVPTDVGAVARALDRHPDFRVLRRLGPFERQERTFIRTDVITGVALDVETTGLKAGDDRIIELAMQRFRADANGRIVDAGPMTAYLEDPKVPISDEITKVTGLRQADVQGRRILDGEAVGMLLGADFIVSHNAAFDRPFVDARLPEVAGMPWACSLKDVDWAGLGFEGRKQSQLVAHIGGFYDAHRASVDVNALLHLLDHALPDGSTILSNMLDSARRPTFRIDAVDAPRSASEALKARGWRWSAARRAWTTEVDEPGKDREVDWAVIHVYAAAGVPTVTRLDWTCRHAA